MSCRYYYYDGSFFGEGNTCSVTGRREKIDESQYNRYCKNGDVSRCYIYKNYMDKNSGGCFITTIVCNILGMKDDCPLLNNFRAFRDNVLHFDPKYYELLKDYDNIGPKISMSIILDKDYKKMAQGIYDNALVSINNLIIEKKYDEACEKYYLLTLSLINYYGLKHSYNHDKDNRVYDENFDVMTSGHGRRILKYNI